MAKTITTIRVTQDHIQRGQAGVASVCPIALAASEAGLREVFVFPVHLAFRPEGCSECSPLRHATLPVEARDFIKAFDARLPVEPVSFTITREES